MGGGGAAPVSMYAPAGTGGDAGGQQAGDYQQYMNKYAGDYKTYMQGGAGGAGGSDKDAASSYAPTLLLAETKSSGTEAHPGQSFKDKYASFASSYMPQGVNMSDKDAV